MSMARRSAPIRGTAVRLRPVDDRIEAADPLAGLLRPVHGEVGAPHEVGGHVPFGVGVGDPDAAAEVDGLAAGPGGRGQQARRSTAPRPDLGCVRSSRTANSSPPRRARKPPLGMPDTSRPASCRSTASPASCPRPSLTSLKPSRSRNSRAPGRRARSHPAGAGRDRDGPERSSSRSRSSSSIREPGQAVVGRLIAQPALRARRSAISSRARAAGGRCRPRAPRARRPAGPERARRLERGCPACREVPSMPMR